MKLALRILVNRFRSWVPFFAGAILLVYGLGSNTRVPTGDAPHLLAIADKLADMLKAGHFLEFFESWSSLVTPHPPAGYLVPTLFNLLGAAVSTPIWVGLTGLALAWNGMVLLARHEDREGWGPWLGWILMLSTASTWLAIEQMYWDVLAAGCVAACVGHLHASDGLRNSGHSMCFGLLMGLGFVTKYTFPAFLILPVLFAGLAVIRFRSISGILISLSGFCLVAAPWLYTYGESVWAYVVQSSSASLSLSDSPASSWTYRFTAENLLYYPTVLRDMLGWPGIILVGIAFARGWRTFAGRWAAWGVLSGLVVLTFAGENQSRYLLPALPLLAAIVDIGIRPGLSRATSRFGIVVGLSATLPALWGAWSSVRSSDTPPASRDQTHAIEGLLEWGDWPWPAVPFRPISNPMKAWRVDETIAAISSFTGPGSHQIGLLLPRDIRLPPASTYAWRAGVRGLDWDVATIVSQGPGGRPMIFVGPLKPMGHRISRRFKVAYAIHSRGQIPTLFQALSAERVWSHELQAGMEGSIFTVPDKGWASSVGQVLQRDPIDG